MPEKVCNTEDCFNGYADNSSGRTQAWREGWYIKRNGESWCPNCLPEWVRKRRGGVEV